MSDLLPRVGRFLSDGNWEFVIETCAFILTIYNNEYRKLTLNIVVIDWDESALTEMRVLWGKNCAGWGSYVPFCSTLIFKVFFIFSDISWISQWKVYLAAVSPARDEGASYVAWGHSLVVNPWWVYDNVIFTCIFLSIDYFIP